MMTRNDVYLITPHASVDPLGRDLAFVIYANRSWEYVPHSEL